MIYNSLKNGFAVFKHGKAYTVTNATTGYNVYGLREMRDPNAVHISDGIPITSIDRAFPLVITSPKKANWHHFSKSDGIANLVIPQFSRDEMQALRSLAFQDMPGCDADSVNERFTKWGGSARNVLTKGMDPVWQNALENAPQALMFSELQRVFRSTSSLEGAVADISMHRLLNLVPMGALPGSTLMPSHPDYFLFHHAELSSVYVECKFADALLQENASQLYHFLHVASTDPSIAGFRGTLYERTIVIPRFQQGRGKSDDGKLPLERLSPLSPSLSHLLPAVLGDGATSLDLSQHMPLVNFDTAEEIKAQWHKHQTAVFKPLNKNFPGIDFVLRLDGVPFLGNATVSEKHDIKVGNTNVRKLLKAVGLLSPLEPDVDGEDVVGATDGIKAGGAAVSAPASDSVARSFDSAAAAQGRGKKRHSSVDLGAAGASGVGAAASVAGGASASDGNDSAIPFLWVLPQEAFPRFTTPGPLMSKSGAVLGGDVRMNHKVGRRFVQYKLLVQVPEEQTARGHCGSVTALAGAAVDGSNGAAGTTGVAGCRQGQQ